MGPRPSTPLDEYSQGIPGAEPIETLVTPCRRGGSRSTLAVISGRSRYADGFLAPIPRSSVCSTARFPGQGD